MRARRSRKGRGTRRQSTRNCQRPNGALGDLIGSLATQARRRPVISCTKHRRWRRAGGNEGTP